MFKILRPKKSLTIDNINAELKNKGYNEFDVLSFYMKGFKSIGKPINSDLRDNDKNASLHTKIINGRIIISDFGLKTGMSVYDYIALKYFGETKKDFIKALNLVRKDFNLNNILGLPEIKINHKNLLPKRHNIQLTTNTIKPKIEVKRRRKNGKIYWKKEDILYWKEYGISIEKLEEKKIAPLSAFWITNEYERKKFNVENELCYVYPFFRDEEGHFMYKIYLPKGLKGNMNFKWISNVNKKVIQNIQFIPKQGEYLIIQSSFKDIMLMEELNPEIYAISPNGEGMWFSDKKWEELRKNWKHIIIYGNNDFNKKDNPGLNFARKHSLKYKIPFFINPDNTSSDISDYYKKYGKDKTKELLNYFIKMVRELT